MPPRRTWPSNKLLLIRQDENKAKTVENEKAAI